MADLDLDFLSGPVQRSDGRWVMPAAVPLDVRTGVADEAAMLALTGTTTRRTVAHRPDGDWLFVGAGSYGTSTLDQWRQLPAGSGGTTEVVFQGTGGTADQAAALQAAVDGMKVSGHLTGTLRVRGVVRTSAAVVLDGGYANVTSSANWAAGQDEPFRFIVDGALKPDASVPVAVTARGMYGPDVAVRLYGGGARRAVTNASITAAASTLTSATAAFTSADVGRVVQIEGAGRFGVAPHVARIASVTNGTTAVLSAAAVTTVASATCVIRTVGLHIANLIHADISATARNYAGTVLLHDGTGNSNADIVTQSRVRKLYALSCGQATTVKHLVGGFGAFEEVWDSACVDGSVFSDGADLQLVHWENYSPNTQTVGLLFDEIYNAACTNIALGDNPTQALMRVVGGDGNVINRLYTTSNTATKVGLDLVEVKSITIDTVQSDRCSIGVQIRGGASDGITIRKHFSLTGDTIGAKVTAGPSTTYMQMVDLGGYWNFTGSQAVLIDSSVTGGRVKVHGQVDSTVNQSGGSGIKTVDCQAANVVLDVAGLTQLANNGTVAAGVAHVTTANLLGLTEARLGNGPAPTAYPVTRVGNGYAADVANTTAATDLVSYTIPGNALAAGATFRVRASGTFDNIATSGAFVWAIKHGTQDVFWRNPSYASAQTGAIWTVDATVVYRTVGASATAVGVTTYYSTVTGETAAAKQRTSTTVNTTVDQAIHLVITMGTAAAGNAVHVDSATIERLA